MYIIWRNTLLSHRYTSPVIKKQQADQPLPVVRSAWHDELCNRGRLGNRRLPETLTERVLHIIRENYIDFGPTLARKKLEETHGLIFRYTN